MPDYVGGKDTVSLPTISNGYKAVFLLSFIKRKAVSNTGFIKISQNFLPLRQLNHFIFE